MAIQHSLFYASHAEYPGHVLFESTCSTVMIGPKQNYVTSYNQICYKSWRRKAWAGISDTVCGVWHSYSYICCPWESKQIISINRSGHRKHGEGGATRWWLCTSFPDQFHSIGQGSQTRETALILQCQMLSLQSLHNVTAYRNFHICPSQIIYIFRVDTR